MKTRLPGDVSAPGGRRSRFGLGRPPALGVLLLGMLPVIALAVSCLSCTEGGLPPTPAGTDAPSPGDVSAPPTPLPAPRMEGAVSLEEALAGRRSVRDYLGEPLTLAELGQLLWAAQGTTAPSGRGRAAPSAGGLYPLETYVVVGDVRGLEAGVYRYRTERHDLVRIGGGDRRAELAASCLGQECVRAGAVDLVITGFYARTTAKYGDRGVRYVHMEAGHAAQNVYLQAFALGLGTVSVGAFADDGVRRILGLAPEETPLYVMPVGTLSNEQAVEE